MPDGRIIQLSISPKTQDAAEAFNCSLDKLPKVTVLAIHKSAEDILKGYKKGEAAFKKAYPDIDIDLAFGRKSRMRLVDINHPFYNKKMFWQEAVDFLKTHEHQQIDFIPPLKEVLPISEHILRYYQFDDGSIVSAFTYYKGETDVENLPIAQVLIQHIFESYANMQQFWDEAVMLRR